MKEDMLWTGAGQIGTGIARRIGYDKKIIIGDKNLVMPRLVQKL